MCTPGRLSGSSHSRRNRGDKKKAVLVDGFQNYFKAIIN